MTKTETPERLFFDEHQWQTVRAAAARIIPTDHDPGAEEAGAVEFIDRYLSGIEYVYANPWGSGFLRLEGLRAEAWRNRIGRLRDRYVEGLRRMDEVSREKFGADFVDLDDAKRDEVLVVISGKPMPRHVVLGQEAGGPAGPADGEVILLSQPVSDEGMDFFGTLVLHSRMGFYADPAYGGNKGHAGWKTIGFPGPSSMAETTDNRFSTLEYTEPWTEAESAAGDR